MRSLDERMAEITRRSEEIIRARKQRRKRILGVCALPVLCTVLILPAVTGMGYFDKNSSIIPEIQDGIRDDRDAIDILYGMSGTPILDGSDNAAGTVEVHGKGFSQRCSSAENVQRIIDLLTNVQITDNGAVILENYESYESNQGMGGCTITVTDSEGIQTEYILRRGLLTNCATKETFTVPEMELSELMRLLGISND